MTEKNTFKNGARLNLEHHGLTEADMKQKVLEAAAAILDYNGELAIEDNVGEFVVTYKDFIVLDDCASLIDDPDYAGEDGNLPDLHDLDDVCEWLRHRAQSGCSDQYYPNEENFKYWGKNFYTRITK